MRHALYYFRFRMAEVSKRNIRPQEHATSLELMGLGRPVSQPYFVMDYQEICFHFGTFVKLKG